MAGFEKFGNRFMFSGAGDYCLAAELITIYPRTSVTPAIINTAPIGETTYSRSKYAPYNNRAKPPRKIIIPAIINRKV